MTTVNAENEKELLTSMGDRLDGIDCVMEKNDKGFNKFDKSIWSRARGNIFAMKVTLKKYRGQLSSYFGEEAYNSINWNVEVPKHYIIPERVDGGIALKLQGERLEGDRFGKYLAAHRALKSDGFRWNGESWVAPFSFEFAPYIASMKELGIEVEPVPAISVHEAEVAKVEVERRKESVVKPNSATVSLLPDGRFAIRHPYSENMNRAYWDAEQFGGIVKWDGQLKARLVGAGDIEDLLDAQALLKKVHPEWSVFVNPEVEKEIARVEMVRAEYRKPTPEILAVVKAGTELIPHQVEGVKILNEKDGKALNGDDMGLGKTLQTLIWAAMNGKSLIVLCPKNVRRQWIQEAAKFFDASMFKGLELDAKMDPKDILNARKNGYNLMTMNYEIVDKFKNELMKCGFDALVLDESHRVKNPTANITRNVVDLAKVFNHRILMSGTPIKNKKNEIYTQANIIAPGTFTSKSQVTFMPVFDVKETMKSFFFRRTKRAELKNLPEKIRTRVSLPNGKELPDWTPGMEVGEISSLKSQLAIGKTKYTMEFVSDILENTESKVIVYSDSDDAAEIIAKHFGKEAVIHTGSTSHEKREAAKIVFMDENSQVRVFVATTGSAREGLNLTVADKVVFNDLPWTPADLSQAEDRAHRIGQKRAVNVYWLTVDGNRFDSRICSLLWNKMDIYKKVIEGRKPTKEEKAVFEAKIAPSEIVKEMAK